MSEAYWSGCELRQFDMQRLQDRYVMLLRGSYEKDVDDVYHVIELPLDASDTQFSQAIDSALHQVMDGWKTARNQAREAKKLSYYPLISAIERYDSRRRNKWGARHATIRFSVQGEIRIDVRWCYELVHRRAFPYATDRKVVVAAVREAFHLAENPPKTRFRYDAHTEILRTDDAICFQRLGVTDGNVWAYSPGEISRASADKHLGEALLDALTALPKISQAEYKRKFPLNFDSELVWKYENGELLWGGAHDAGHLYFPAAARGRRADITAKVPVDASAAAIGKLVRTTLDRVVRQASVGKLTNAALSQKLERLKFFEFSKRKASLLKKLHTDGWTATLHDSTGRVFHADQEDLAEGGVAALLSKMRPLFQSVGLNIDAAKDDFRDETYDVLIGKRRLPVLMDADFKLEHESPGYLWGIASYRASLILNRLLRDRGRTECAYSLEDGNDHSFVLLTPAMHEAIKSAKGFQAYSGPYRAAPRYPNFGRPVA